MQWRRSVVKKNGNSRRQFSQWTIPKPIRKKLGLNDGSTCTLTARLGTYSLKPRAYVLTSGGEIHLPKDISEDLRLRATATPKAEIVFDIQVEGPMPQPVTLDKAREKALEEGAFDPQNDEDARDRVAALIVRRQGQPAFRKKLLKAYNNRCAISSCDCPDALEAAHIRPYKGKHTNHIKNGILLRSDIHSLVDLGKIRICSNYKVGISDELQSTVYKKFHGKRLLLPKDKKDWPDCSGLT
jgi:bifunctional DNA-binding transcriptional regulator/antitoxin component of YhaV-PrlF toxin-antitoxin module